MNKYPKHLESLDEEDIEKIAFVFGSITNLEGFGFGFSGGVVLMGEDYRERIVVLYLPQESLRLTGWII